MNFNNPSVNVAITLASKFEIRDAPCPKQLDTVNTVSVQSSTSATIFTNSGMPEDAERCKGGQTIDQTPAE
ncbi:hypothetical protein N7495_003379 [Penicillium taxi]|uniref:uncharacterized protein n=1 Tax=Penicillium taxi TaxID=168475 RepID=UPI00254585FD|nr:uncharacterized protein N7495_003379 [Penicillium taxi]KAJ5902851.1 hypothetical protein N7495_003379 [Penicillium taxi]